VVNNCANPGCGKPLHYLREGRIYIFDASAGSAEPGTKRLRRLEHFWLCGACSETLILIQDGQGAVRVFPRPAAIRDRDDLARAVGI